MAAHIDTNQDVASMTFDTVQGDGIHHAPINQYHIVAHYWSIKRRQGDTGANSLKQTAFAKHHLFTRFQIGRYCTVWDWQIFDGYVGYKLHNSLDNTFSFNQMIQREREVG